MSKKRFAVTEDEVLSIALNYLMLEFLQDSVSSALEKESDAYNELSERAQESDIGLEAEDRINDLECTIDCLDDAVSYLESYFNATYPEAVEKAKEEISKWRK